jgi:saccharopine dehydrogenase-like NADP-dependent oxidoreductase
MPVRRLLPLQKSPDMMIAVLGAGMVGRAIAVDLARTFKVTAFDIDARNLELLKSLSANIDVVNTDLGAFAEYSKLLSTFDLVVSAVPGFLGFRALKAVIEAGKNVVDISFFPENALELSALAEANNVTVITDCGVAPGMSNLILGRWNEEMIITTFECYVGGLPKERKPPLQYKAPFSPIDVIEEYIRPARLVENGQVITRPALSDRELMTFDVAGELESFNTDGLRSLVHTMRHIPNMKEKTLRYPGHIDIIIALKQSGFFEAAPIAFNGVNISPLEFTSRLLINQWKLEPGEAEFTIMKVIMRSAETTITYDLFDEYDEATRTSSMARTTGYTCTAAVHLILQGLFKNKGLFPPELVGKERHCFDFVLDYLAERGINWRMKKS